MYTVIGPVKSRAMRVLWMLEELGEAYNHIDAAPRSDEARTYNPSGKVPALIDGAEVLTDSMAILTYLADKHGKLHRTGGHSCAGAAGRDDLLAGRRIRRDPLGSSKTQFCLAAGTPRTGGQRLPQGRVQRIRRSTGRKTQWAVSDGRSPYGSGHSRLSLPELGCRRWIPARG